MNTKLTPRLSQASAMDFHLVAVKCQVKHRDGRPMPRLHQIGDQQPPVALDGSQRVTNGLGHRA